ncbi:hypothetical protein Micbo1qcDRAFT_161471 [Microdochium bolleyi]|uniref:Uncharacterized protein n=1 Tax=Microdochium bolleyi TaxID=196109 RepID=A0A136J8H4_9PEZI|nr:hypothetical protein Micbo1qcDRAFT_161471 [Microdochium bolleyi]
MPLLQQGQQQQSFYQPQQMVANQTQVPLQMRAVGTTQPGVQYVYQQPQMQPQAQLQPRVVAYPAQQQVLYQQPQQVQVKQPKPRVPSSGATQKAAAHAMAQGFRRAFGGTEKVSRKPIGAVPVVPVQPQPGVASVPVYANGQFQQVAAPVGLQPMPMQQHVASAPPPMQFVQHAQIQPAPVHQGGQNGAYPNTQMSAAAITRRPVVGSGTPQPTGGQLGNPPIANANPASQNSVYTAPMQTPVSIPTSTAPLSQSPANNGIRAAASVPPPAASASPPSFLHNSPGIFPGFLDSHKPNPQFSGGGIPYSPAQPAQATVVSPPSTQAVGNAVASPPATSNIAGETTGKSTSARELAPYAPKAAAGVAAVAVLAAGAGVAAVKIDQARNRGHRPGPQNGAGDEKEEEETVPDDENTYAAAAGPNDQAVSSTEQETQNGDEPKLAEDPAQDPVEPKVAENETQASAEPQNTEVDDVNNTEEPKVSESDHLNTNEPKATEDETLGVTEPKPSDEQQTVGDGGTDFQPNENAEPVHEQESVAACPEPSGAASFEPASNNEGESDYAAFVPIDQSTLGGGFDPAGAQPGYFDPSAAGGATYDPLSEASSNLAVQQMAQSEATIYDGVGYSDPYASSTMGHANFGAAGPPPESAYTGANAYNSEAQLAQDGQLNSQALIDGEQTSYPAYTDPNMYSGGGGDQLAQEGQLNSQALIDGERMSNPAYSDPNGYGGGGDQMAQEGQLNSQALIDGEQSYYPAYDPMQQQQVLQEQPVVYVDQTGQQFTYTDPNATAGTWETAAADGGGGFASAGAETDFAAVVGEDGGAATESIATAVAEGGGGVDWGGVLDSISSWGL